ncbi:hypothetical protein PYW08_012049 [Mythimna loreyi]|uniref:Uncharacterized protein n=1 Tax=Mythimna loreyi TaxID=667449 RepID=A0ACC2QRA8_9NEOP|nr:hypothetical protein PYW08_012049 [Mythimna loreyi]
MRSDLKGGIEMLESANNNAETIAVMDLTERYEFLVMELDGMTRLFTNLGVVQKQITDELKTLVECVEMLREQKADRDEVADGLRDKADLTRMAGLLHEKDFAQARFEIEKRIEKSYDKFQKQDEVWQAAMRDMSHIADQKSDLVALMAFKERATNELNMAREKQNQLEIMLGEPEAALLTRHLATSAACGSCLTPAVMALKDATYGKPALLPALRPTPLGAEDPCVAEEPLHPPDNRRHICLRWVGGSHTLMAAHVSREKAAQARLGTIPTKKYTGYGTDGRLYMMEDDLLPCVECNKFSADDADGLHPRSPTPIGDGDRAHGLVGSKRESAPKPSHT